MFCVEFHTAFVLLSMITRQEFGSILTDQSHNGHIWFHPDCMGVTFSGTVGGWLKHTEVGSAVIMPRKIRGCNKVTFEHFHGLEDF